MTTSQNRRIHDCLMESRACVVAYEYLIVHHPEQAYGKALQVQDLSSELREIASTRIPTVPLSQACTIAGIQFP